MRSLFPKIPAVHLILRFVDEQLETKKNILSSIGANLTDATEGNK